MSAHAPLAPSSAPQWGHCSGSVAASLGAPQIETQANREGTAAHWVVSECLTEWRDGRVPSISKYVGRTAENGTVIDEDMVDAAEVMVKDVMAVLQRFGGLSALLIEHRVEMSGIHPDNWGTPDAAVHIRHQNVLYVWDFKYGHRQVDAFGNLQLIDYAAGLIPSDARADMEVVFRIVQPRCYRADGPISEWRTTVAELQPYFGRLQAQAHEAMTCPTMTAGKWCRDCPAVGRCATARQYLYGLVDYVNRPYLIDTMSGSDLAFERRILTEGSAVMKARLQAIDDELESRITNGDTSTGLSVQPGQGRLEWAAPVAQVLAMGQQFGVNLQKPAAMTPTQSKKLVPVGMRVMFEEVLKTFATRKSTGIKLIESTESRTAKAFQPKRK